MCLHEIAVYPRHQTDPRYVEGYSLPTKAGAHHRGDLTVDKVEDNERHGSVPGKQLPEVVLLEMFARA